jgi:hypothetical protein
MSAAGFSTAALRACTTINGSRLRGSLVVVDLWGRCGSCAQWFDCEGWFDLDVPEPRCPECAQPPVELVNRAAVHGMRVVIHPTSRGDLQEAN